jgi:hypothetical protein
MGLLDRLKVDLGKTKANEIEDSMKGNGLPAIGLHHAVLEGCREVTANSGSTGFELRFKVIGGASKGAEVKETLWLSDKERAKNRVLLFMHRLGMLNKVSKNGQEHFLPVAGKNELHDCLGAEVVIDVSEHETREANGKKYTNAVLSFEGVLRLDDKRAEKVARGNAAEAKASVASAGAGMGGMSGGAGAMAGASASKGASTQQTFDDI